MGTFRGRGDRISFGRSTESCTTGFLWTWRITSVHPSPVVPLLPSEFTLALVADPDQTPQPEREAVVSFP